MGLREFLKPRPFRNLTLEDLEIAIDVAEKEVVKLIKGNMPTLADIERIKIEYLKEELERKKNK